MLMPFFLRRITKTKWLERNPSWLQGDDIPADPLGDLRTQSNKLSVWQVEDDQPLLMQVAMAMTTMSGNVSHFHYALIDQVAFKKINIKVEDAPGNSHYKQANTLHYNLIELSASDLVQLARVIYDSKMGFIPKDKLLPSLAKAVESGEIPKSDLNKHVIEDIEKQTARDQGNS
jgi:hypothetical protein